MYIIWLNANTIIITNLKIEKWYFSLFTVATSQGWKWKCKRSFINGNYCLLNIFIKVKISCHKWKKQPINNINSTQPTDTQYTKLYTGNLHRVQCGCLVEIVTRHWPNAGSNFMKWNFINPQATVTGLQFEQKGQHSICTTVRGSNKPELLLVCCKCLYL